MQSVRGTKNVLKRRTIFPVKLFYIVPDEPTYNTCRSAIVINALYEAFMTTI